MPSAYLYRSVPLILNLEPPENENVSPYTWVSCLSLTSVSRGEGRRQLGATTGNVTLPGSGVRALPPTRCPEGLSHVQAGEYKVQPLPRTGVHQQAGMTKPVKWALEG